MKNFQKPSRRRNETKLARHIKNTFHSLGQEKRVLDASGFRTGNFWSSDYVTRISRIIGKLLKNILVSGSRPNSQITLEMPFFTTRIKNASKSLEVLERQIFETQTALQKCSDEIIKSLFDSPLTIRYNIWEKNQLLLVFLKSRLGYQNLHVKFQKFSKSSRQQIKPELTYHIKMRFFKLIVKNAPQVSEIWKHRFFQVRTCSQNFPNSEKFSKTFSEDNWVQTFVSHYKHIFSFWGREAF